MREPRDGQTEREVLLLQLLPLQRGWWGAGPRVPPPPPRQPGAAGRQLGQLLGGGRQLGQLLGGGHQLGQLLGGGRQLGQQQLGGGHQLGQLLFSVVQDSRGCRPAAAALSETSRLTESEQRRYLGQDKTGLEFC